MLITGLVQLNNTRKYDGYLTGNYDPVFTPEEIQKFKDNSDPIFYPNTNWVDMLFKKMSLQTQHNINLRGGTERVKYLLLWVYLLREVCIIIQIWFLIIMLRFVMKGYNFRTNFQILK